MTDAVLRLGWSRRRETLDARADRLLERASALVGELPTPASPALTIDEAAERCLSALESASPAVADVSAIATLVADLQQLALELPDHELVSGTLRLAECERGLGRLRGCTTTAALLDRVCQEASRSCGLERILLSRVQEGRWHPWVVNDAVADEPWIAEWSTNSIPLDPLTLEARLLEEHRPALITDTSAVDIHPIIRQGRSHSYVVAPIVPAGRVVGFFHADHLTDGRVCDATDRDVLWRFAEGFGHLYERTALLEDIRAQRNRVRGLLSTVEQTMDELAEAEVELAATPDGDAAPGALAVVRAMSTNLEELTPREREVLELVATGARNSEIAERLAIGEGTVKTHVRHILAKLGAVNRSQVIAQYLGFRDSWRD